MPVVPATLESEAGKIIEPRGAEVAVSRDHTTALQPRQQSKIQFPKKKKSLKLKDTNIQ